VVKFLCTLAALAGCTPPPTVQSAQRHTAPLNAAEVDASTYLADTGVGTGTAWVVSPGYLMTAGHVCAMSLNTGAIWLKNPAGEVIRAEPRVFEVSRGPGADLCVLVTEGPTAPPLPLAGREPPVGAPDSMVGYPLGEHSVVTGQYLGHDQSSDPTDHGNSGSPMFSPTGVYGLCVQLHEDGSPGCSGTGVAEIRRLLQRTGV
jgi:hypothetical protein